MLHIKQVYVVKFFPVNTMLPHASKIRQ